MAGRFLFFCALVAWLGSVWVWRTKPVVPKRKGFSSSAWLGFGAAWLGSVWLGFEPAKLLHQRKQNDEKNNVNSFEAAPEFQRSQRVWLLFLNEL